MNGNRINLSPGESVEMEINFDADNGPPVLCFECGGCGKEVTGEIKPGKNRIFCKECGSEGGCLEVTISESENRKILDV